MLAYLDNWLSIGPHSQAAGKNGQSGLNENFSRELMELHTVGVDGGYSQSDVTQLATILTGWTIAQPEDGGQFQFDPRRHEPGDKAVLGHKFYDAGQDEGMHALDMLAHSPATAHFISKCLPPGLSPMIRPNRSSRDWPPFFGLPTATSAKSCVPCFNLQSSGVRRPMTPNSKRLLNM